MPQGTERMRTRALVAAGLVSLVTATMAGCGSDEPTAESVSTIMYTYVGSSTAPDFHQEYVIEVTPEEATIRVGSYGTVDGSEEPEGTVTVPITDEVWSELVADTSTLPSGEDADGCTGGSTRTVEVEEADGQARSTSIYDCGSANEKASEQLEDVIDPVLALFDLDELDRRD